MNLDHFLVNVEKNLLIDKLKSLELIQPIDNVMFMYLINILTNVLLTVNANHLQIVLNVLETRMV